MTAGALSVVRSNWPVNQSVRWNLQRLRHLADIRPSNVDKKSVDGEVDVRLCNYTDVYYNDSITADASFMPATAPLAQVKRFELRQDDVLVTKDSETPADIAIAAHVRDELSGVLCGYHLAILRPLPHVAGRFLLYALQSQPLAAQTEVAASGVTRFSLSTGALADLTLPVPDRAEQRTIADFLDRETEKIDALIAKKQRLIELLQEKRTALISRAVTKGLDPDVPMKDSGIEWLGEIPVRWIALPLRRGLLGVEQGWSPECGTRPADDQEWGVLKAGCVNHGEFAPGQNKALPSNLTPRAQLEVRAGDVLMSRASGSAELVGSVAYISECRGRLMLSDKVFRLLVDSRRADAKFVALALNSRETRAQIESVLSGSVGLARNIGQPTVRELALCFPPLDEQRDIVRVLEAKELSTRMIVSKADDVLERLREYRSALITAAVTGQIDVRTYRREAS